MTRSGTNKDRCVMNGRVGLAPVKLAIAFSLSALMAACAPDEGVSNNGVSDSTKETINVRWTEHGIPHITAQTWEGLGFGFAHSVAQNGVCVLAKELVTVNGELSKYFGAENGNVNSDAFHRALLNDAKIDEYLGASSADSNAMDSGYARGYNRYIDTHADQLPASCAGAEWVKPIDERDLARLAIGVGIRYGLGRVTDQIATATHNQAIASLKPIDLSLDVEKIGSNAYAFGSELTDTGRGILLGNPHYPWQGPSRFHMAHLTLPGEIYFMGVGLIATPRLAIGFNETIAWSHTVSTALRFTFFRLDLVPGNPMLYLVGDQERPIEAIKVAVETATGIENRTVT